MIYESEKSSFLRTTPYCSQYFCPFSEDILLQNDHILLKRHAGFSVKLSACQSPKVQLKNILSHKQVLLQFYSLLWQEDYLCLGLSTRSSLLLQFCFGWMQKHILLGVTDSKIKSLCYFLDSIFHGARKIYLWTL